MKSLPILASAAMAFIFAFAAGQTGAQSYAPGPGDDGPGYYGDQGQDGWGSQPPPPSYGQAQERYQEQQQDYLEGQQRYSNQAAAYQARQNAYIDRQEDYRRRHEQYVRARSDYDMEYGQGAFEAYWRAYPRAYDDRYGPGAYARDFGY